MASPYDAVFQPTPPPPVSPKRFVGPSGSPYDAVFAAPPRTYLTGGPLEKVFDVLRTGEYAVGGVLSGKGVARGIRERTESGPQFALKLQAMGAPDSFVTDAAAFAASLVLDPINLVGAGVVGKGLRAIGATRAAEGLARVGPTLTAPLRRTVGSAYDAVFPGMARAAAGRRALEPALETMVRAEAAGVERAVTLGKALRQDAARLTGSRVKAAELDKAVGLYFDAGADTMLNQIARTQAGADLAPVVANARRAGLAAQDAWLLSQPEAVQTFVRKWAPRLAAEDKRLGEELVLSGMMKPETAAKWEGLHLRRIYQQFEDPQEFVKFLEQTDPVKAAALLGKIERGIPIQKVGAPIPTGVTKQRKIIGEEAQVAKGVIRQASSRYIAGGTLAERAVARGQAYQKIAQEFGVAEDMVRANPLAANFFRQMPDTGGWGALAGKWLPKELADPLLRLTKKPEGMDALLQRTTGWFKFAKVILNPATHMRNIRTNVALAHNSVGLGALNPITWARAIREVATNGDLFKEAKTVSSAFTDTFTATELRVLITDPSERGIINTFRRGMAWAARQYQAEEQIGKMVVYLTAKKQGFSPQAAAKTAELALFNYRKVPPVIDRMRRIGIYPFITFPYKVATETIPQAIRRPGRFSQQTKLIAAGSDQLTDDERRVLPEYLREGYVKLPYKVNGHPTLFQLSYELPYGDISETGTPLTAALNAWRKWRSGDLKLDEALRTAIPVMPPLMQIAAELLLNRSAFRGRDIVPEGETNREALKLLTYHVARFALPSIISKTVVPGGEFRRAVEAAVPGGATGVTPAGEEALPLREAALSTFVGLKMKPIDLQREQRNRRLALRRALEDNKARLFSVRYNRSLEDIPRARRIAELREERRRIMERFRETGLP